MSNNQTKAQKRSQKKLPNAAARRAMRPAVIDPNQFYSIDEVAAAREKCRAGVYDEIKQGRLRVVKDGTRTKILGAEIIRANQQQAAAAA